MTAAAVEPVGWNEYWSETVREGGGAKKAKQRYCSTTNAVKPVQYHIGGTAYIM